LVLPFNLAANVPPSATLLNQSSTWIGWGMLLVGLGALAPADKSRRASSTRGTDARRLGVLAAFSACILGAVLLVVAKGGAENHGQTGAFVGTIVGALLLAISVSGQMVPGPDESSATAANWFRLVNAALVVAGICGATVGAIQVFASAFVDGHWIAAPTVPGRAVGNLRQPNHLASVLLWAMVAAVWLYEDAQRRSAAVIWGTAGVAMGLLLGLVLTASRTGAAGVLVLAAWGLLDRRLTRATRIGLAVSPFVYAAIWWTVDAALASDGAAFAGSQRLAQEGLSTSRWAIWANTLELIGMHPWMGVGVGEFNFAWTLTEFSRPRPQEFFDHSHNLVLQLWVELGLPLGTLVLALLGYALWRAFRAPACAPDARTALMQRCAFMIVLLALMHSMLEYPLWYAHFLFPVAFFWGICLARPQLAASAGVTSVQAGGADAGAAAPTGLARRGWGTLAIGAALMAGGVLMLVDYLRVVPIFDPPARAAPLPERIAAGQRSWFFAHHADYALVTTYKEPVRTLDDFRRPTHFLLDARLMQAWAEALAAAGDVDRARWVAQRLAEFQRPSSRAFFAPCEAPAADGASHPFQCEPPTRRYTLEDFR
jgi:O-antigen ligase